MLVDGQELSSSNTQAWRRNIGYVPQQIFLADGTIAENIAFGVAAKKVDMSRVEYAAKIAQLDELIKRRLPAGFQTDVGQNGVQLSGGQRQRIGIARALYTEPDLIVFDEATSALDNVTEKRLIESIESMAGNKTLIMVAHRLSTVKNCDRILMFKDGRVVGNGTWAQLTSNSPDFRSLASDSDESE